MVARALLFAGVVSGLCGAVVAAPPDTKDAFTVVRASGPRDPAAEARAVKALEAVLPRLESSQIFERLEAQDEVRRVVGSRLGTVEALLSTANLSPEQAERLSSLGYAMFAAQPRAAMGVRFGLAQGAGEGVVLDGAVPGFDSARVLLPGDAILSIAGTPVREQMDARRVIISFDPGDEVAMEISRDGQVRDVRVKLGAFTDLNGFRTVDSASLRLAWETRIARVRRTAVQEPLGTGLPRERADALRTPTALPKVFRPRGQAEPADMTSTAGDGALMVAAGRLRGAQPSYNRPFRFRAVKGDVLSEIEMRSDQSDKWAAQARAVRAALRDARLPFEQRLRQEFNLAQDEKQVLVGAGERRDLWKSLRAEQEASEEPH